MGVAGFDHVALPTAHPEEVVYFYTRLGFVSVGVEEWRAGTARAFSLAFGDAKINVHPPAAWQDPGFTLRGPSAVPGCGDLCFVWEGGLEDLRVTLAKAGAEVISGPIPRLGGRALGSTTGTSLYTRDPDGNLLEFMVYE